MDELILNEMYFGTIPQLLMVEELFEKLKRSYSKKNCIENVRLYRELIKDPILTKIGKLLSDTFGFKEVAITLSRDDTINAYTISFAADSKNRGYDVSSNPHEFSEIKNAVTITNRGFKFNTKHFPVNLLVCFTLGALFDKKMTIRELMAIMMHEIGHNFSKVVIQPNKVNGRVDERFADQFVAMYGYAEDMISGFSKLETQGDSILRRIPIINVIYGLSILFDQFLVGTLGLDPHPAVISRMKSQIEQLKADLKDVNMSPEMRKDLEQQIKKCEMKIEEVHKWDHDDNMTNNMIRKYNQYIADKLPGESIMQSSSNRTVNPNVLNKSINDMKEKSLRPFRLMKLHFT